MFPAHEGHTQLN